MSGVTFNLSSVFSTVAAAIGDQPFLVWRDRRFSYAEFDARVDGFAHFLAAAGLGCHTERDTLHGHESGQDHLGIYLRNGNQYLESMIGAYRARVAPFNVSYRYVEEELVYLLNDSKARADLQRGVRPAGGRHPGPRTASAGADPGRRRIRERPTARCRGLRGDPEHPRPRRRTARRVRR
ncbi:MAG: AMP-binding protein [Microbacteriaceae bacterium]